MLGEKLKGYQTHRAKRHLSVILFIPVSFCFGLGKANARFIFLFQFLLRFEPLWGQ